jgi:hypothetical protein
MLWGNVVNSIATAEALRQFLAARLRRHALVWRKTEHAYPADSSCGQGRPRLGEILVRMRAAAIGDVDEALLARPHGTRLGEYLVQLQCVSEENLYQALSLQGEIPWGLPARHEVDPRVVRALPAETVRRWKVMPYRVEAGQLHLITPDLPSAEMTAELRKLSALEIRFRLVRPREFELLSGDYLPGRRTP